MESIKTNSKNYIGQIKELLRAPDFGEREPKVLLSVTTPSATLLCTFQNLRCQFSQDIALIVGVFVVVGIYFAVKSALDKHYTKKVAAERAETILRLHDGIREVYLNRKRH